jgi:hypothetical protein
MAPLCAAYRTGDGTIRHGKRGATDAGASLVGLTWSRSCRCGQRIVALAAVHLDHDATKNRLRNLRSLCQRCHMIHDRPHYLALGRITYLLRRALGDLFLGPYRVSPLVEATGQIGLSWTATAKRSRGW